MGSQQRFQSSLLQQTWSSWVRRMPSQKSRIWTSAFRTLWDTIRLKRSRTGSPRRLLSKSESSSRIVVPPEKESGDRVADLSEMLVLKEANDNHVEEHTIAEFIEWCENGRTEKSGTWESKGTGKYFEGGVEAGGQMVDQRFCPRIDEGEARFVMIGKKLYRVEHYVYIGGVGGETKTTIYPASSPDFPDTN